MKKMAKKSKSVKVKKPYQKPLINQVKLATDEMLIAGCKMGGGTVFSPNNTNCQPAKCVDPGT
ncbi:unnamed protein product [marine sediment metagenome]|uniref:Uncharacterized protein n=1 Tax=marine sediment metagenome TaxID=412755 RepID=X1J2Y1_9ZZZZ